MPAPRDRDVRDYGDRGLLVGCDGTDDVIAVAAALREAAPPEVSDIVPGARTVLLTLRAAGLQASVRARLAVLNDLNDLNDLTDRDSPDPGGRRHGPQHPGEVVIDVVYDGADLSEVAATLAMTPAEVAAAHAGTAWRVGFVGFAPGFAYLVDGDPRLQVPRRAEPRTRVPAGAVALAGEYSGVYPRESPGGWQVIGHTDAVLWDAGRPDPALLTPGVTVRFRAVDGPVR